MFIRTKSFTHRNTVYTYAYVTKSQRKLGKIKQRNIKYLGKVYKPFKLNILSPDYIENDIINSIKLKNPIEIIIKLVEFELYNHGFTKNNCGLFINDKITVDLSNMKVLGKNNNNVVLEINEGFLCNHTLIDLFNLKFPNLNEKDSAKYLANKLLNAGIYLTDNLFINLYKKFSF